MLEEVQDAINDNDRMSLTVLNREWDDLSVGRCAPVDFFRLVKRLAALPQLDDEWIAGLGHGSVAPITGDQECVFVDPGYILFGRGQHETIFSKFTGLEVELSLGIGVFAAVGERDETEAVAGIETVEPFLNPFLVVLRG